MINQQHAWEIKSQFHFKAMQVFLFILNCNFAA